MRNMVIGFLVLILGAIMFVPEARAQNSNSYSKEELQRLYIDYLTERGNEPSADKDGDVIFTRFNKTYFIDVTENDPEYMAAYE